jgi:hypothetical protein
MNGNKSGRGHRQHGQRKLLRIAKNDFLVVIHWVPNSNNKQTFGKQIQILYPDVRHWEELFHFIEKF